MRLSGQRRVLLAAAAALAAVVAGAPRTYAAYCHGKPSSDATANTNPIDTAPPRLIRTTTNGKAFQAGTSDAPFWVMHLWGTPYEMGYAHGSMMQTEVKQMVNRTWAYLESQVEDSLNGLPNWLKDWVANEGLEVALDLTLALTKNFTGDYFFEELKGIANGAGIDYQTIVRIHMIGELTQGKCSMFGAWANSTLGGKTLQLRALDWDTEGPFKDFASVTVYHPKNLGHDFANVGFIGWIGALTGQSSAHMAISEIGVTFPDATFGKESRVGIPFVFLLRDILQFDTSYLDSISRIQNAHRTCDLILGVGDGKAKTFRGFEYSYSVADVMTDTNMRPDNSTWHPRMANIVYYGMDWLCPSYNKVLSEQLSKNYGSLTPELAVSNIVSYTQTGNLHVAVYDLTDNNMFVSFMRATDGIGPEYAYERTYTKLDLDTLFSEAPPALRH